MGATTGLHPDDARRKLRSQPDQGLPSHPTPHDNRAGRVEADHAAHVLAEIDAKDRNIHTHSSS
jgi:hypothetical protein